MSNVSKALTAVRAAEKRLHEKCQDQEIGADCERACLYGGMTVVGEVIAAYKGQIPDYLQGKKGKKLGIIVSKPSDCPEGFEHIIVKTPRNRNVVICRLGPKVRKYYATPGKPYRPGAHKGSLRRKRKYDRGTELKPIQHSRGY